MAKIIVVTGKGGVGKSTTLAALLVDTLESLPPSSKVLIIDGDPDQTLDTIIGIQEPDHTLADIRDQKVDALTLRSSGVTMAQYLQKQLLEKGVLVSRQIASRPVDFLAMGRSKEAGCYCGVNNALATVFADLQDLYDYIFVDSPAGTEHLSRYRIKRADFLIVVQGTSAASVRVKSAILDTIQQTGMEVGSVVNVVNHTRDFASSMPQNGGLHIPFDTVVAEYAATERPLALLPNNNPLRKKLHSVTERLIG